MGTTSAQRLTAAAGWMLNAAQEGPPPADSAHCLQTICDVLAKPLSGVRRTSGNAGQFVDGFARNEVGFLRCCGSSDGMKNVTHNTPQMRL